jgi:hypothetical protein
LIDCTLTANSAGSGGGAAYTTLSKCVVTSNSAFFEGGGALHSTLNNCLLTGNSVPANYGGGAAWSSLSNCTLTANSAFYGGGTYQGALGNCIVQFNTATNGDNHLDAALDYCCTTPLPPSGTGNITNDPAFVDYAGGNLRLQTNSPCINAGLNAYAPGTTDLDGNPRIVGGTVDIGAYEFQGTPLTPFQLWLQSYGLPTDGSADYLDSDGDGMNNWQEWRCQTNPTNAVSALRLLSALSDGTNVTVTWQSVAGVSYFLGRSTDLSATPAFSLLATNLLGQPGMTSYIDTNAAAAPQFFYRVGVP